MKSHALSHLVNNSIFNSNQSQEGGDGPAVDQPHANACWTGGGRGGSRR